MMNDREDRQSLKIVHLATSIGKASFGIGPIVLGLAGSQRMLNHAPAIWCEGESAEVESLARAHGLDSEQVRCFDAAGPRRLGFSPAMEAAVEQNHSAVLHQHGIWTCVSRVTNRWQDYTGGPTVIAPQGSLDAWALRRSRWKKRLALLAYEKLNLQRAACLHALSRREAEAFRAFGLTNPIAVIPNGISESWLAAKGDATPFRQRFSIPQSARLMLFLGRITPKKGLPMLLGAMASYRACLGDWRLIIAGVDEFGHEAQVRELVSDLDMEDLVRFVGPLYGQDKRDAFAAAELFVLPSHSEGAPMVILEALGAGTPVLTTNASPWEDLLTHDCGWLTEISEPSLAEGLKSALSASQATLASMGRRGKTLVAERYTWPRVAESTIMLYRWLLGDAPRPEFVESD